MDNDNDNDKGIIQVDYTPLDVIVIDSKSKTNRTKPSATILTDVYTRKIIGFNVTHPDKSH